MVSDKDRYKRALVTLLRTLAALYGCALGVTRGSADAEVRKAYQPTNQPAAMLLDWSALGSGLSIPGWQ